MVRLGENTRRLALVAVAAGGLMAVVVVAATVALPLLVPAADLRRAAIEAVAGTTERGVTITGEPALQLLPTPRLVLRKVTFALPHDQSLDADAVVSRISLWPLLLGHIAISEVILESPTLVLSGARTAPELGIAPFLTAADAPELRVEDGTIAWRDSSGLTRELVSGIVARIDRIAGGRGIAVSSVFDWREAVVEADITLDDMKAFLSGTPTPARADVTSNTANLRFRGAAGYGAHMVASGTLSAEADSLRAALDWLGLPVPTRRGFGPFSFSSQLALDDQKLSLTKTSISLDGNRAEGGVLAEMKAGRPLVQGTFASDQLNLDPYGRMRLTSDGGRDWSREPLDISLLEAFDLDLRLSAGQVTTESTTFTTVAASAVLSGGRLVLALGQTSGWSGMLRGTATLTPLWAGRGADGAGLAIKVEGEGSDIALQQALADIAGLSAFEGTGALQFDLGGEGRTPQQIAESLTGSVSLTSAGGYLSGFDVAQVLRRIERRPLSGADELRGGRTPFTRLKVRAQLRDGLATLQVLQVEGKQARLDMTGSIDVARRTLDISGEAALTAAPKPGEPDEFTLPFVVQGAWVAPRIMADPLSLIERSGAAQPLLEAVKNHKAAPSVATPIHTLIEKLVQPSATLGDDKLAPAN